MRSKNAPAASPSSSSHSERQKVSTVRPRRVMMNNATSRARLRRGAAPCGGHYREERKGFPLHHRRHNAERILTAAKCAGDGRWFIEKARNAPKTRRCSGVGSGAARASSSHREGLRERRGRSLMVEKAASLSTGRAVRRRGEPGEAPGRRCRGGGQRRRSDLRRRRLRRRVRRRARKFRETRLYQVAPGSCFRRT